MLEGVISGCCAGDLLLVSRTRFAGVDVALDPADAVIVMYVGSRWMKYKEAVSVVDLDDPNWFDDIEKHRVSWTRVYDVIREGSHAMMFGSESVRVLSRFSDAAAASD